MSAAPEAPADAERNTWADLLAEGRLPRFALICLGVWLGAADSLVTATVMPSVGADLGGYGLFGWATAGFLLGSVVAGASAGWLSERTGLRPAMLGAGLTYAAGCALSAAGPDMAVFLLGRVLQGVAAGWIGGLSYVALALLFPERHLARVFAAISAVWGVATLLGPLLGGLFAEAGAWRGVFWMFAAQGVLFTVAAWPLLAGAAPASAPGLGVPWRQLLLIAAGVGAIGSADRTGSAAGAAGLVGVGLLLLGQALRLDARASVRLLPRRAADVGGVIGSGYLALFALTAATMGLSVYGPAILQTLRGFTSLEAGYLIAAESLAWTAMALLIAGQPPSRDPALIRLGAVCVLAGAVLLALAVPSGPLAVVIAGAALLGGGFGFSYSAMSRRVLAALPDEDRALGASGLGAVRGTGSAVGAAVSGVAANLAGLQAGLDATSASAAAVGVFWIAVPIGAVGLWAAFRLAVARR